MIRFILLMEYLLTSLYAATGRSCLGSFTGGTYSAALSIGGTLQRVPPKPAVGRTWTKWARTINQVSHPEYGPADPREISTESQGKVICHTTRWAMRLWGAVSSSCQVSSRVLLQGLRHKVTQRVGQRGGPAGIAFVREGRRGRCTGAAEGV